MSFKEGLFHARHHLIFILGLAIAFGIIIYLETQRFVPKAEFGNIKKTLDIPLADNASLSAEQKEWAEVAWRYFINNTQASGLVNSVDTYPATTLWDQASYLLALISAERLEIIKREEFDRRLNKLLNALHAIDLFEDALPNKSYNTIDLAMVDYNNQASDKGIGWSAIDIARFLVPLNIIIWNYPEHGEKIKKVVARWDFSKMIQDGVMIGAAVDKLGETEYVQEGRIGYEEYAARSLSLMGFDVNDAARYDDYLKLIEIDNIEIPTDARDPKIYKAHNYVVSESYLLHAIEFGLDHITKEFALRVYQAQENRYERSGILTAVSEDNIDRPPYFVYNTVFTDGKAWNAITDTGADASEHKTLSTKAAFGWHLLLDTAYTRKLMSKVKKLKDPTKGWYSGLYEKTNEPNKAITANTNAVILESLSYKQFGPSVAIHLPVINPNQQIAEIE